uniref:Uncharacterized protein n=1 Tax=Pavo cristatus TaxID=9049 RepID=A0A8C9G351_PAVCR
MYSSLLRWSKYSPKLNKDFCVSIYHKEELLMPYGKYISPFHDIPLFAGSKEVYIFVWRDGLWSVSFLRIKL